MHVLYQPRKFFFSHVTFPKNFNTFLPSGSVFFIRQLRKLEANYFYFQYWPEFLLIFELCFDRLKFLVDIGFLSQLPQVMEN